MMRSRIVALVICVSVVASACATEPPTEVMRWRKPDATYDQFMKQRYTCAQEASRTKSDGVVNQYGGRTATRSVVSLSLFQACMGASGWREQRDGFSAPAGAMILMED